MYAFDYQRPTSRDAAKSAAAGADTRYLAGGQSLIQAMRLRLSQSERLVDLGAVADLKGIRAENNGVTIGAMSTHATVASNADVKRVVPAIAELAGGIGDPMVRNMGTIGGSIANADPAACYPAGVLAFNATIHTDRRTIAADDFFTGLWETALKPGELITAVAFPAAQKAAYVKYRQPASRFPGLNRCVSTPRRHMSTRGMPRPRSWLSANVEGTSVREASRWIWSTRFHAQFSRKGTP